MIASECVSVELLEDLVLTVEALLESLVGYYQQLLWELPPVESQILRALAEGAPLQTVGDIADEIDRDPRLVSTTLKRLGAKHWVEATKRPGHDRRKTWYRLQDGMLRLHMRYRAGDREELRARVAAA